MKYLIYLLIITSSSLASCKKQPARPLLRENQVGINQCKSFNIDGRTITCCLDSVVQDSRCPTDVECIWAGVAVARFAVTIDNGPHTITLATLKSWANGSDTSLAGIKIEMTNLLPLRSFHNPPAYNDYVAELNVTAH